MWIKILCIEYILWGIPTIESTFDVANMVKTATVKDVPINNDALLNIHMRPVKFMFGKMLSAPLFGSSPNMIISARVPLISTRVSVHCHSTVIVCNGQDRHEHFYDGCTKYTLDINQSITVFNWCTQEVISCK